MGFSLSITETKIKGESGSPRQMTCLHWICFPLSSFTKIERLVKFSRCESKQTICFQKSTSFPGACEAALVHLVIYLFKVEFHSQEALVRLVTGLLQNLVSKYSQSLSMLA